MLKIKKQKWISLTILLVLCVVVGSILVSYGGTVFIEIKTRLNNSSQPVGTLSNLIMMASTGLFFLIILLILIQEKFSQNHPLKINSEKNNVVLGWSFGVFSITVLMIATILIVNPRGLYGTDNYKPRWLLVRPIKVDAYLNLPSTPDVVILGSSRTFTLSPTYIHQHFGYTAFNASVEGSRLGELPVFLKFIAAHSINDFPKVIILEALPYILESPVPERMPSSLLPYMELTDKLRWWYARYDGMFDLDQLSESIFSALREPKETNDWTFTSDGEGILQITTTELLNQAVGQAISDGPPDCQQPTHRAVMYYHELVSLAYQHKASIIFIITPMHPGYFAAFMAPSSQFYACKTQAIQVLENLANENINIFFLDYSDLARIGGVPTAEGYYDSQHMTEYNSNLLLNTARDTIERAYQLAAQWRIR
jgi:hypothetical protein